MLFFSLVCSALAFISTVSRINITPDCCYHGTKALSVAHYGYTPTYDLAVSRYGFSPSVALSVAHYGYTPSYDLAVPRYGSSPSVALSVARHGYAPPYDLPVSGWSAAGAQPGMPRVSYGMMAGALGVGVLLVFLAVHCASGSHAQPVALPVRRRTRKIDPPEAPLLEIDFEWPAEWPEVKEKKVKKVKKARKRVRGGAKNKH